MKIILVFLSLLSITKISSTDTLQCSNSKNLNEFNIDSFKWNFYLMNYDMNAEHYKFSNFPTVNFLSCDASLSLIDSSIKDTVIYYFHIYYKEEQYNTTSLSFGGIGYSFKEDNLFPVLRGGLSIPVMSEADRNLFFQNKEKGFLEFLQKNNRIDSCNKWLKEEIYRRHITF